MATRTITGGVMTTSAFFEYLSVHEPTTELAAQLSELHAWRLQRAAMAGPEVASR
jgi:hypothetical protein